MSSGWAGVCRRDLVVNQRPSGGSWLKKQWLLLIPNVIYKIWIPLNPQFKPLILLFLLRVWQFEPGSPDQESDTPTTTIGHRVSHFRSHAAMHYEIMEALARGEDKYSDRLNGGERGAWKYQRQIRKSFTFDIYSSDETRIKLATYQVWKPMQKMETTGRVQEEERRSWRIDSFLFKSMLMYSHR